MKKIHERAGELWVYAPRAVQLVIVTILHLIESDIDRNFLPIYVLRLAIELSEERMLLCYNER